MTTYDNVRGIRFFAIKRELVQKNRQFFVYVSLKYSASFKIASLKTFFSLLVKLIEKLSIFSNIVFVSLILKQV